MVTSADKDKKTIRIGFDDVDTWPEWCVRVPQNCRDCHLQGKILFHPRFRTGVVRPPKAIITHVEKGDEVIALLKSGKRPLEVHQQTGVSLNTIYSIGQRLRDSGQIPRLLKLHPESQKKEVIAYVKAHPDEQYITIAPKFGVERSYVCRLASKAGIHRRKYLQNKRDANISKIVEILENDPGRSIASVAEQFGMTPATVSFHLQRRGKLAINHEARVFLESVRKEVIAAVLEAFHILKEHRIIVVEPTVEKDEKR